MTPEQEVSTYLLIETTVAAAIIGPDGKPAGQNVAETTLQFGWRAQDVPAGTSDERINEVLRQRLGPLLAAVQVMMTSNGWVYMGTTDEPLTSVSHPTGAVAETDAIKVLLPLPVMPEATA